MGTRLELHDKLCGVMESLNLSKNVYFQPPESIKMTYPCIIYSRISADTKFADNFPYTVKKRYMITVIDKNPDSLIPGEIEKLPGCVYERFYTSDNLNHDVYLIYF